MSSSRTHQIRSSISGVHRINTSRPVPLGELINAGRGRCDSPANCGRNVFNFSLFCLFLVRHLASLAWSSSPLRRLQRRRHRLRSSQDGNTHADEPHTNGHVFALALSPSPGASRAPTCSIRRAAKSLTALCTAVHTPQVTAKAIEPSPGL